MFAYFVGTPMESAWKVGFQDHGNKLPTEILNIYVSRAGFRGGGLCESGRDGLTSQLLVIVCLSFRRRYIAEWFEQTVVIKSGPTPA